MENLTFADVLAAVILGNGLMMFFGYLLVKGDYVHRKTGETPARYMWGFLAVGIVFMVVGYVVRG